MNEWCVALHHSYLSPAGFEGTQINILRESIHSHLLNRDCKVLNNYIEKLNCSNNGNSVLRRKKDYSTHVPYNNLRT